ncbi:hypothetical protein QUF54_03485 [Candidatus Marithioploca araucensis]|uniref:Uncharacterized protein n=1 Tax=Candidatus Marithioploca araucensis TaxID=70273 RepID=A0ABT7VRY3_9GAMM|nr:hypothetical protein [Candidatus Marithioploca araucensis]
MNRLIVQLFLILTSIISTLYTSADAKPLYSFTANEVASLKWGTGARQVALSKVPANNFGPSSFAVNHKGTSFYFLDSANQRIAVIKNNQFSSIPLSSDGANDFCLSDNHFYLLFNDKVVLYNRVGRLLKTYPITNNITPIAIQCPLILESFEGHFYRINQNAPLQFIPIGQYAFSIKRRNGSQWTLRLRDNKTDARQDIAIKNRDGSIETLNVIGIDKEGNIYLTVEELISKNRTDEKVIRLLRKYTPFGELIAEVELAYSLYAYTLKDLAVTPLGDVFQMLPFPDSLKVIKWTQTGSSKSFVVDYSAKWSYLGEPDDFYLSETPADHTARKEMRRFEEARSTKKWQSGSSITRQKVIDKAKKYVKYKFTVKKSNLTKGIYDKRGKLVITPISKPGTYTAMPYKWGGGDTLNSFRRGLKKGKKAGDKCAKTCSGKYVGSSLAVGVDCSGFVSRVWGLKGKQSTRTLPRISTKLRSKNHLKPGDILNKAGAHVRLFSHKSAGRFFVYEATGSRHTWKVIKHSYRLSQLKRYKPYRYRGMIVNSRVKKKVQKPVRKTPQKTIIKSDKPKDIVAHKPKDIVAHKPKGTVAQIKWLQSPKSVATVKLWRNDRGRQATTDDSITLKYKVSDLISQKHAYFTLFNISPQKEWSILIENKRIKVGKLYRFPSSKPLEYGQPLKREKRLSLEAGYEYFKAVVTTDSIRWSTFFKSKKVKLERVLGTKRLIIDVHAN